MTLDIRSAGLVDPYEDGVASVNLDSYLAEQRERRLDAGLLTASATAPQYMHIPGPPGEVGPGPGQQQAGPRALAQFSPYVAQLMERNGMGAERMPHTHERMARLIEGGQPLVSADRLRQFVNNPQAMQALCNNLERYLQTNPADADRIRQNLETLGQIQRTGNITANQIAALSRTEVGAYAAATDINRHFVRTNMIANVEAAAQQANTQAGFRLASSHLTRPPNALGPDVPDQGPRYAPVLDPVT